MTPEESPEVRDCFGVKIEKGDLITYPVRDKSEMWMVPAKVRGWHFRQRIDLDKLEGEGEIYCNLGVWIMTEVEGETKPRRATISALNRIVKLEPSHLETDERIRELSEMPVED